MAPGSAIVNVATTGALRAVPGTDAYVAAKGGVIALSKAMAVSLGELSVRVNVVCPGVVLTEEVASRTTEPRVLAMMSRPASHWAVASASRPSSPRWCGSCAAPRRPTSTAQ